MTSPSTNPTALVGALGAVTFVAAASCGYPTFTFGSGAGGREPTSSSSTSSASDASTTSSGYTCADVHGSFGCCDPAGNNDFCIDGAIVSEPCPVECGWDAPNSWYSCAGDGPDPTGEHPIDCGSP